MLKRIFIISFIIVAAFGYSLYQKNVLKKQLAGHTEAILSRVPISVFETLEGEPFDVHEFYTKERVELLVVHFWGTWCAPCEAEFPELLAFMKRFENRPGVKFLLVAVNDEAQKVKRHLKRLGIPKASITWLVDNKNIHRDVFGTTRVPETYVFSSDMTTLRKYMGPQQWNKSMFFQTFDEFIQISTHKL